MAPLKTKTLTVCLDTNVIISAVVFGGKPLKILSGALSREFRHVTGTNILGEVQRNLLGKLQLPKSNVEKLIADISDISTVFVPHGKVNYINHVQDNLVLEIAITGNCDVLVTGDRKHLLPLKKINQTHIEPPSKFLERLENLKTRG